MLGAGVGRFEFLAVASGLAQVAPDEQEKEDRQQKGAARCPGQRESGLAAHLSGVGCAGVGQSLLFGVEVGQQQVGTLADGHALTANAPDGPFEVGACFHAETARFVLHVADEACHGVGRVDVAYKSVDRDVAHHLLHRDGVALRRHECFGQAAEKTLLLRWAHDAVCLHTDAALDPLVGHAVPEAPDLLHLCVVEAGHVAAPDHLYQGEHGFALFGDQCPQGVKACLLGSVSHELAERVEPDKGRVDKGRVSFDAVGLACADADDCGLGFVKGKDEVERRAAPPGDQGFFGGRPFEHFELSPDAVERRDDQGQQKGVAEEYLAVLFPFYFFHALSFSGRKDNANTGQVR